MAAAGPEVAGAVSGPVELLERSLAWVRPVLAAVPGHPGATPTPCAGWDLTALLTHLVDGFTAFTEAASGWVRPPPPASTPAGSTADVPAVGAAAVPADPGLLARRLLDLGCTVLGSWTSTNASTCRIGPARLPASALLEVAALEISVHGWDLAQVCAPDRHLPAELAAALLPVAVHYVTPGDRPGRFAPVVEVARRDPAALLLAHLGRRPA